MHSTDYDPLQTMISEACQVCATSLTVCIVPCEASAGVEAPHPMAIHSIVACCLETADRRARQLPVYVSTFYAFSAFYARILYFLPDLLLVRVASFCFTTVFLSWSHQHQSQHGP